MSNFLSYSQAVQTVTQTLTLTLTLTLTITLTLTLTLNLPQTLTLTLTITLTLNLSLTLTITLTLNLPLTLTLTPILNLIMNMNTAVVELGGDFRFSFFVSIFELNFNQFLIVVLMFKTKQTFHFDYKMRALTCTTHRGWNKCFLAKKVEIFFQLLLV